MAGVIVGAYDFDFDHTFGFYSNMKMITSEECMNFAIGRKASDQLMRVKKKIGDVWKKVGDKMMLLAIMAMDNSRQNFPVLATNYLENPAPFEYQHSAETISRL